MLDNTITLPVDELENDTLVNQDYTRYDEYNNRTIYVGTGHTLAQRDTMTVSRTFPKPSGNHPGVAKSSLKFTQDISIPGVDTTTTLVAPDIGEVNFSLPVGTTPAQAMMLRQRIVAALNSQTFIVALTESLQV